jgi:two-component system phosphate regulon sensor histidine kinase PhoR
MCLVSVITLLIASASILYILYGSFTSQMKAELANEAHYLAQAVEIGGTAYLNVTGAASENRITYIASDGTVLYDNEADAEAMENHAERPEVVQAMQDGEGEATRHSDTIGEKTYYYAVRLSDASILRIANTVKSFYGVIASVGAVIALICAASLLFAMVVSRLLTRAVIKPFDAIDLENPLRNKKTYDELVPFLTRIEKQNRTIRAQIETITSKQSEIEYIAENMREAFLIFGANGVVLYANKSAEAVFHGALGRHYTALMRASGYLEAVKAAVGGEASAFRVTFEGRIYAANIAPVREADGRYAAVLLLSDRTEGEAAEEMRRAFSANVSHELKTPLSSIIGYAEIIENGLADRADVPEFASRIRREAQRQLALIEDIIRLSNLDEQSFEGAFETVDLYEIAAEAKDSLAGKAADKNIALELSGTQSMMRGIRHLLYEVVHNLCDNAVSYTPAGGRVDVCVTHAGGSVALTVSDNGIGIPSGDIARIFERFYRVDKSRSKETGGTGLGLSIVKHAVAVHNGTINVESREGAGTRITVTFAADAQ